MKSAFETISEKLEAGGMEKDEIDELLGKFLEEEAFDYVENLTKLFKEYLKRQKEDTLSA